MKVSTILFKFVTKNQVFFYRFTNGKLGSKMGSLSLLLLTTVGRKTGRKRTVILAYIRDVENYVITASAAGSDKNPDWFFNLEANPDVEIQVKDKRINARANIADTKKRDQLWKRLTKVAPGYKAYEKRTKRIIPMVILHPSN